MKRNTMAILAAAVSNAIFGFSFMFSRIALRVADPAALLMYRFIFAFVLISGIAFVSSRSGRFPAWLRFDLRKKPIKPLLGLALFQPVLYFIGENYGLDMTNATIGGVIIALIPIIAMALGAVFLKEKGRPLQWVFAVISIIGVIVMTLQQSAGGEIRWQGILLLIGAALSGALYNIFSRKISAAYSPLECTFVMMGSGAVVFSAIALVKGVDLSVIRDPGMLVSLLYLSVLSSIAAFLLLNFANSCLPVARTTAFCNLTTVISMFAGVLFLGEPFSAMSLVAVALILAGIVGVQHFAQK